ncbi:hypothetical protein B0J14DRAFT_592708 [Halenospora varia]|nr:hypothetical protein B0J14DRAFT_592708 [Halenospora varia]
MTVTEFAILPLNPITYPPDTLSLESPLPTALTQKLHQAQQTLQTASAHGFHFFRQVEDTSKLYILGAWDSVAAHETFLPSKENIELLDLLQDDVVIEGIVMYHLDIDIFSVPPSQKAVITAPTISLNRHFIASSPSSRSSFLDKFSEIQHHLVNYTTPYQVIGGWRIEKEEGLERGKERQEFVLFSGFESVEGFEEYSGIKGCVEGFEVRHLRALKL